MEHRLVRSAFSLWMLTCMLLLPASSSGVVRIGLTKQRLDLHATNAARMSRQEAVAGAGSRATIKYLGKACSIAYGSGSIPGFFSQDNVEVGDLVVKDQVFIEATKEVGLTFLLAKFDGMFTLGFQEISVGDAVPVWIL